MSDTDRWIMATFLFLLFGLLAIVNAIYWWRSVKDCSGSVAPIFGGLFGALGLLLMPVGTLSDRFLWCWVPLVLDLGCLPYLLSGTVAQWRSKWDKKSVHGKS